MQDEAGAPLIAADDTPTPSPSSASGPQTHERTAPATPRRTLFVILGTTAVLAYASDQLSKIWALDRLTPGEPISVIGSLIRLNLIRNAGAAFSIGNGATWVMTLIACAVLVFIIVSARRIGSARWAVALGLLLGGAMGNLTDRMVRPPGPGRGQVVDFIDYVGLFIGNVADIAIVGAAVFVAFLSLSGIGVDGTRARRGRHAADGDATSVEPESRHG